MIRTVNLTKVFRTDEVETTALNEVSFEIVGENKNPIISKPNFTQKNEQKLLQDELEHKNVAEQKTAQKTRRLRLWCNKMIYEIC